VVRNRIEEADGGIKQVGGMAQTKLRGVQRVARVFVFKAAAHNWFGCRCRQNESARNRPKAASAALRQRQNR
jgi:hypothetical protein